MDRKEYLESVEKSDEKIIKNLAEHREANPPDSEVITDEEKLINDLEGQRDFAKNQWQYWAISTIAFLWSAYQIYVVIVPTNTVFIRSVHLAFAVLLAFMMYPIVKTSILKSKITWYDFIFAFAGIAFVLYKYYAYQELSDRSGAWLPIDVIMGVGVIVIVIEASRRVLGSALAIISIFFLAYDYLGPYMPDLIAHKGASLHKMVGQMSLTTEGIYGVPLGVSAGYVFLFVLFGSLLERAGAGEYFINLAYSLLGKYDGGPAKASVAASGLMGIISGSSIANTVTTGTFTIPLMKKLGFPPYKAAAVEVASSVNGQLMPPIMGAAAFIIAEFLGLAYTEVVMTAFVPAFVSYFALFYIVHLEAKKQGIKGEDPNKLPKAFGIFIRGIHYIIPVFFLIYTLIVLRQSAQMAAFNAIIFISLIMITQKPIFALLRKQKLTLGIFIEGFHDIGLGMINGAKNMVSIAVATAVAGIVVGSVTLTGIGLILADVIDQLSGGYILAVLGLTAVVSLILGMGLPTTANYIVMASLTAPVIMQLAGDNGYLIPAIAAHLFVFYFGILADDTPPVGMAAYAAAGIARSDPIKTGLQGFAYDIRTAILPFMFFFNNKLLLIESVDAADPNDPSGWVWITNPAEIAMIFSTAVLGMFAFSNATQGWFITHVRIYERLMLICVVPLMFLPEIMAEKLGLPSFYFSYLLGIIIYALVYFLQKMRVKKVHA